MIKTLLAPWIVDGKNDVPISKPTVEQNNGKKYYVLNLSITQGTLDRIVTTPEAQATAYALSHSKNPVSEGVSVPATIVGTVINRHPTHGMEV